MNLEHDFTIWGSVCDCGTECSILQNKVHPWDNINLIIRLVCPKCGKVVDIDKNKATEFYNNKIFSYYDDLYGTVMDLGCGGGLLTKHILKNEDITRITCIDNDESYHKKIKALSTTDRIQYFNLNITNLTEYSRSKSIDFMICRDVCMFVDDTDKFFDDISRIVINGMRIMGWYIPDHKNMHNTLHPEEICKEFNERGWKTKLEYLNWYKSGYFISVQACD